MPELVNAADAFGRLTPRSRRPAAGELHEAGVFRVAMRVSEPGDGDWTDQALCAQTDPEAFFPEKGGSTREAKRVCRNCEVQAECLEAALERGEMFGIFGGLSPQERRRLKSTRGAA